MTVLVIGGGPAGAYAAMAAAEVGAEVVVVDSGPKLGGQYHRRPYDDDTAGAMASNARIAKPRPAHRALTDMPFDELRQALVEHPRIEHRAETTVWTIEPSPRLGHHRVRMLHGPADASGRTALVVDAAAVVIATGAYDRVLPFPGWELPGVYTAGAAQAMAKGQRVAVGRRVVVAGTGPFLFPVAQSLLAVSANVLAVLEANPPGVLLRGWSSRPGALWRHRGKLGELAGYAGVLARHRIPYRPGTAVVAAHGSERVEAVTTARLDDHWNERAGTRRRIPVDAVCLGYGFLPQLELAVAAGCRLRDGFVDVDTRQATSVPGVFAAGEPTGIGGAALAAAEGTVAGIAAAQHRADLRPVRAPTPPAASLGHTSADRSGAQHAPAADESSAEYPQSVETATADAAPDDGPGPAHRPGRRRRGDTPARNPTARRPHPAGGEAGELTRATDQVRTLRAFAEALDQAHPVRPGWHRWLLDDTLVCRCEEVPYRELRDAVDQRLALDARSLKLLCRVGLGPCQGRVCGVNATELANARLRHWGQPRLIAGEGFARRPLATPVRLRDLAAEPGTVDHYDPERPDVAPGPPTHHLDDAQKDAP